MGKLFYVPLEPYKERYTMQWSAPKTGWLERNWLKHNVEYVRVEGEMGNEQRTIKAGSVLDAVGRSVFTFSQITKLLLMAERGEITNEDMIYFDDFWTPGIEALPYAFHLLGIKPRCYAFLHAQSVDEFDFTYPMRHWMRHFEKGIGEFLDGIFVCCPTLQDLVCFGGIAPRSKVHVTGHPFNSEEVMERMPQWYQYYMLGAKVNPPSLTQREDKVVWSSRWDTEKDPLFFLRVARRVIQTMPSAKFVVCTSAPQLRSNDPRLIAALDEAMKAFPGSIVLKAGLTKEQYYEELCTAKIQFNCADQDFVAITLLEASVAGCYPIYPYFRSFPETFLWRPGYMYTKGDAAEASGAVCHILRQEYLWSREAIKSQEWIHSRFDVSWVRMLTKMGLDKWHQCPDLAYPSFYIESLKDPFDAKVH